ncbi:MAG TPA: GatB/YqeY domain-containing protein, partial [Acidimicrobiia bacterium]
AEKLAFEVEYLSRWLPQKLGEEETRALVMETIAELGVAGAEKAAGMVTGHLMKSHGKDLDGGLVNKLVREELQSE